MSAADIIHRWRELRAIPGNERCAECGLPTESGGTEWVVLDYGALICIRCAGAHRALGTHISQVRSSSRDKFSESELEWLASLGNTKSSLLWEAALPARMRRPRADSPDTLRRTWLRLKYVEQEFTAGKEHANPPAHESLGGWLLKRGSFFKSSKRRWFRIVGGAALEYFADETCAEAARRGALPLRGAVVTYVDEDEPLQLTLSWPREGGGGARPSLHLRADSPAEAEQWVWALFQCAHAAAVSAGAEAEGEARAHAVNEPPGSER